MGAPIARATLIRFALVMIVYAIAARMGLAFASISDAVTLVWAPAGIGLAAVLRWGPGMAGAVGAGNLIAGLLTGHPVAFALWAAFGAAAEALLGAFLIQRSGRFDRDLASIRDVLALVTMGGFVSTAAAGAFGATGLALFGMIGWDVWGPAALRWWAGDAMGILIVAPLGIAWPRRRRWWRHVPGRRIAEAAIVALLLCVTGLMVFHSDPLQVRFSPIVFVVIPPNLWAVFRFGPPGAALAGLTLAVLAVSGTLLGSGPFVGHGHEESLWLMLANIGTVAVGGQLIAALIATHDRTERALREKQSWLDLIEDTALLGTWIWDRERGVIQGSAQRTRLYGISLDDGPITTESLLPYIEPEDLKRVQQAAAEAIGSQGTLDVEFRGVRPDGSTRWYLVQGNCLPHDPGQPDAPVRMVGLTLDITDRKQVDEALRRTERLSSLGTLAAGTAHEINNPLGTILLAARTAQQALDDPETVRTALDDIVEDTQRTARIVKNLLHFARSGSSARSQQDLNDCIRRAAALARPYGSQRAVSLDLALADEPLPIRANATEIEQVFSNLIRNAIEGSSRGSRVAIESERLDDRVRASVTDRGRGISESDLDRIFDPFFTTRASEGGSGLGLSICHGIVTAHAGTLEVTSEVGVGTRMTLSLPVGDPEPPTPHS